LAPRPTPSSRRRPTTCRRRARSWSWALGARTLAWLAREHGHRTTAVDFSDEALATARRWATAHDLPLDTTQADVRTWTPDRQWDAALVTFLQLLPDERPALYRLLRQIVRPGGWIFGEWFRPDHLQGDYDRMDPSWADRMVPVDEVRAAFADDEILRCDPTDVRLQEGPLLNGDAAVVRAIVRKDHDEDGRGAWEKAPPERAGLPQ